MYARTTCTIGGSPEGAPARTGTLRSVASLRSVRSLRPMRSLLLPPSLLVLSLLASGCFASGPSEPTSGLLTTADGINPILLVPAGTPHRWPMDPWSYLSHRVEEDLLTLHIQYGGGCRDHRFALLVDPAFMESHPVQVAARLAHDADGDPCRALVGRTLRFDLTPLKEHYRNAYGPGPATVILQLAGQPIAYDF